MRAGAAQDILAGALASLAGGGQTGVGQTGVVLAAAGYVEIGPQLSVNLADGLAVRIDRPDPGRQALRIESGWPQWLSLEVWLPDSSAGTCALEVDLVAERDCTAHALLRRIAAGGTATDGPAQPVTLGGGPQTLRLEVGAPGGGRRKAVVVLGGPPATITLRRLVLSAAAAEGPATQGGPVP